MHYLHNRNLLPYMFVLQIAYVMFIIMHCDSIFTSVLIFLLHYIFINVLLYAATMFHFHIFLATLLLVACGLQRLYCR